MKIKILVLEFRHFYGGYVYFMVKISSIRPPPHIHLRYKIDKI